MRAVGRRGRAATGLGGRRRRGEGHAGGWAPRVLGRRVGRGGGGGGVSNDDGRADWGRTGAVRRRRAWPLSLAPHVPGHCPGRGPSEATRGQADLTWKGRRGVQRSRWWRRQQRQARVGRWLLDPRNGSSADAVGWRFGGSRSRGATLLRGGVAAAVGACRASSAVPRAGAMVGKNGSVKICFETVRNALSTKNGTPRVWKAHNSGVFQDHSPKID